MSERGIQRIAVTKGAADEGGGGIGNEETNCIERVSTTEIELPEGNARRPWGLRSADPKLLRVAGPGSIDSHDSCDDNCDCDDTNALGLALPNIFDHSNSI